MRYLSKFKTFMLSFILIILTIDLLRQSNLVITSAVYGINLWKEVVFPSLFPFFVISDLLISYGFVNFLGELFEKPMRKFFNISGSGSFVLILSMVSGFPSGAKYTAKLLNDDEITLNEANRLLLFTHFSNPLFVFGAIAVKFIGANVGLLIYLSHISINFVIGLGLGLSKRNKTAKNNTSIKKAFNKMHYIRTHQDETFGEILSKAVLSSLNTMLLILGIIVVFLIFTTVLNRYLILPVNVKSFLNGLIEMSQGLGTLKYLQMSIRTKAVIATFFISFGGLSVHAQVLSMIANTKISYLPYLVTRIIHAILASTLVYVLYGIYI